VVCLQPSRLTLFQVTIDRSEINTSNSNYIATAHRLNQLFSSIYSSMDCTQPTSILCFC